MALTLHFYIGGEGEGEGRNSGKNVYVLLSILDEVLEVCPGVTFLLSA